jgi:medium-chain acyl-[acyl-carrier-protein] hydrolase
MGMNVVTATMTSTQAWVSIPPPTSQSHLRLFCFPYAGGSASIFRSWVNVLGPNIQVCPVHLPGRERRIKEPPFTQLETLVSALANALQCHLDRPFAFFGHSMGALISFELARELRRKNVTSPEYLFISGRHAPQLASLTPPIHRLSQLAFMDALHHYQGTPNNVFENAELMQLLLPTLRADFSLCETYVYSEEDPLGCPISVFGGLQDKYANPLSLQGWQKQTSNSFSLQLFEGNHFFLNTLGNQLFQAINQHVGALLQK